MEQLRTSSAVHTGMQGSRAELAFPQMARCFQTRSSNPWFLLPQHASIGQKAERGDPGAPHVPAKPVGLTPRCYRDKELRTKIKISPCPYPRPCTQQVLCCSKPPQKEPCLEQGWSRTQHTEEGLERLNSTGCVPPAAAGAGSGPGGVGQGLDLPWGQPQPSCCRQGSGRVFVFFFLP